MKFKELRKSLGLKTSPFDDIPTSPDDNGPEENYPFYILRKQQEIKSKFKRVGKTKNEVKKKK